MTSLICKKCQRTFAIDDEDFLFYKKISVPPPTLCPDCRQRRRLSHRNLTNLYHRQCDFSKKKIISMYSPDKPCLVYDQEIWWSDKWDPLQYGRDFDFNKGFFEQFHELRKIVPRPNLINKNSVNSEYTHHSESNKNTYMGFNVGFCEDCMYITNFSLYCKNCADCYGVQRCERCYECLDSKNCFNCSYAILSLQCTDSQFLYNCRNVQNSFLCWDLQNKQYHFLNQPYSKEEYQEKLKEWWNGSHLKREEAFKNFLSVVKEKAIHRYAYILASERCTGDLIFNSKNVRDSFFALDSEDCRYCYDMGEMKDCYDVYEPYVGELQYETHASNNGTMLIGCSICYYNNNLAYCEFCHDSSDLFGCIGLRHKKYCILNKQYSREEYFSLRQRIIEHMQRGGEYGEFFPMEHSLFAYNESVAQEYYPSTKEQILAEGLQWKEEDKQNYRPATAQLPETISETPDMITTQLLACEECSRNYQILPQELTFYREMHLPPPRKCFFCRHKARLALRNPRQLWKRPCMKCGTPVESNFAPERRETVFCEKCYLEAVY